jgi:Ca2+-transporting ATPase
MAARRLGPSPQGRLEPCCALVMARPPESAQGLDSADAARRLAVDGPNQLPDGQRRRWPRILLDVAREPMFLLLAGAAALYLTLGEAREGAFLLFMVVFMMAMTLFQEGRTERALEALRDLSAPAALVLRDGILQRIPGTQLVRGDLIELAEGDRVPADALVLEANGVLVDESLLTGESVPVSKTCAPEGALASAPGGDALAWIYSGTLIVQGHARARVTATGVRSELGRIGAELRNITPPSGRLQRETSVLARRLAIFGIGLSLLLVLVLGLRSGNWMQALLAGVALSMSVLPEEFPVILTVFPALGAWRLARAQVLTRRLAAIEVLGSTSVLCVDKTGTLTENRMALSLLWQAGQQISPGGSTPLTQPQRELVDTALLACRENASDPIEQAFWQLAASLQLRNPNHLAQAEREYGLTPTRPALIRAWRMPNGERIVAAKGAPETVISFCDLDDDQRSAALAAAASMARKGLRVLAIGRAKASAGDGSALPDDPAALRYTLLGLAALADPLRPDIPSAVASCLGAGMRLVMITGDHPQTALAIARQAGLQEGALLTGSDISGLDDGELERRLDGVSVCARIVPQQKLRIVRALQRTGEVVAMTGDGVNDAPALRAADVGVAMGKRGTDVAREAAQLTLLDDRFASLVQAIAAGRRIFSNMRKSMTYVMAMHVPIVGMALLPALLGWPVMLYPLHIVFLELVIDPACSLAFENEPAERGLMQRPPRSRSEPLFGRAKIADALVQGAWTMAIVASACGWSLTRLAETEARAFTFSSLVLCNLALLLANRQSDGLAGALRSANSVFWIIASLALGLLLLALYFAPAAAMFGFSAPPPAWMAGAAALALLSLTGVELGRKAWHLGASGRLSSR